MQTRSNAAIVTEVELCGTDEVREEVGKRDSPVPKKLLSRRPMEQAQVNLHRFCAFFWILQRHLMKQVLRGYQ